MTTLRFKLTQERLLAPIDEPAWDCIDQLDIGQVVLLERVHERDMFQHRKIFAQIAELAKAVGTDPELLRAELLYETGNCHFIGELFNKVLIAVHSMGRHAMTDHQLLEFWSDAKDVIAAKILPRIKNEAERERLARTLSLQEA